MSDKDKTPSRLYIVVGLSGAGKSTAIRVFEDHRYFAVDGLPVAVAPDVASIMDAGAMSHFPGMAIGLDIRQDKFLEQFRQTCSTLKNSNKNPVIIFLEADDKTLIHRYASTRRPHPFENDKSGLEAAIAAERVLLQPVRDMADLIIDSAGMSIHDLRRHLQKYVLNREKRKLQLNLLSFGFKYGIPQDADFVFDLRFLPNPYFVETLRGLSGLDAKVSQYVFASELSQKYAKYLTELLSFILQTLEDEGRYRLTVALGCTGGRHRSVAFAEEIGKKLKQLDFPVSVKHRDMNKV